TYMGTTGGSAVEKIILNSNYNTRTNDFDIAMIKLSGPISVSGKSRALCVCEGVCVCVCAHVCACVYVCPCVLCVCLCVVNWVSLVIGVDIFLMNANTLHSTPLAFPSAA